MTSKLISLSVIFAFLMYSTVGIAEDMDDLLRRGINAYEHADFDRAIAFLDAAIAQGLREDEDLIAAYKFIALARIGKGHPGGAAVAFRKAISLNPSLKLNPNEYSSKVIKLFQQVRDEMVDALTVISNPKGASVFVDGKREGITAQDSGILTLEALIGKRRLRVSKQYFAEKQVSINVVKKGKNTVTVDLEPIKIGLRIRTNPSHANLYVDGQLSGTTPIIIDAAMGSAPPITLTKKGYQDKTVTIRLREYGVAVVDDIEIPFVNEMAYVTITLDLLPPGNLDITSDPPGAEAYLDGELKGTTPLTVNDVAAGIHRLSLNIEKFDEVVQSVEVISNKTVQVKGELGGVLEITSEPTGADVYLDRAAVHEVTFRLRLGLSRSEATYRNQRGHIETLERSEHIGRTPLVTERLAKTQHQLKLSKQGYVNETQKVEVNADFTAIQVRLSRKTGSLSVHSTPPGAVVLLDGEKCGMTPLILYGISVGKHQVKLTKDGYDTWSGQVKLKQRKIKWRNVCLRRKRTRNPESQKSGKPENQKRNVHRSVMTVPKSG